MCVMSDALELAADESVILAYWQMRDRISDSGLLSALPTRLFCLLFSGTYRAARARCPDFDARVRKQLSALHGLEESRCSSVDRAADTFAQLLCSAIPPSGVDSVDRATEQLLYHLGRWIYLIDARDDLDEDRKNGSYNPLALRFQQEEEMDGQLAITLDHSLNLVRAAAALLDTGEYEPIIQNILDHGLTSIQKAVFDGRWSNIKKQKIWRAHHDGSL